MSRFKQLKMVGLPLPVEGPTTREADQRILLSAYFLVANLFVMSTSVISPSDALRMINLDAPETALHGDTIQMSCHFALASGSADAEDGLDSLRDGLESTPSAGDEDLQDETNNRELKVAQGVARYRPAPSEEQVYAIKWYKDDVEFFRFLAQDWPKRQSLPTDGVTVDLDRSDNHTLVLSHVTLKTSGLFKCEVSTDAPTFLTKSIERRLRVYSLASEGPRITSSAGRLAMKQRPVATLHLGERLELLCSAPESKPAASLDWILNERWNLSATNPTGSSKGPNDAARFHFDTQQRRYVRLAPSTLGASSSTTSAGSALQAINYELINGTSLALPLDAGSNTQMPPLNLANSIDQLAESSTASLNLTLDANLLRMLAGDLPPSNVGYPAKPQPQRHPQTSSSGPPRSIQRPQRQVRRDPESLVLLNQNATVSQPDGNTERTNHFRRLKGFTQRPLSISQLSPSDQPIPSRQVQQLKIGQQQAGVSPTSTRPLVVSMEVSETKPMLRIRCVARVLHISMSDEIKFRVTASQRGDSRTEQLRPPQQQLQRHPVDANSGGDTSRVPRVTFLIIGIRLLVTIYLHSNAFSD